MALELIPADNLLRLAVRIPAGPARDRDVNAALASRRTADVAMFGVAAMASAALLLWAFLALLARLEVLGDRHDALRELLPVDLNTQVTRSGIGFFFDEGELSFFYTDKKTHYRQSELRMQYGIQVFKHFSIYLLNFL